MTKAESDESEPEPLTDRERAFLLEPESFSDDETTEVQQ